MKTIPLLLVLGLAQAGLAQTAVVPVQPRHPAVAMPSFGSRPAIYPVDFSSGIYKRPAFCHCEITMYTYAIEGLHGHFSIVKPRKIQVITGGLLAEFAPTPAPAKPFYPTLSQGRYAYH